MGDVPRARCMNVTRDREKGAITLSQKDYTEDVIQRYGMDGCNPAYTTGVGRTAPEPTIEEADERGGEAALSGNFWSRDVPRTGHPLRHPVRCQPAREGHVRVRESSHGGGHASASLLGRVHRRLHHLQVGWFQTCCRRLG